MTNPRTAQIVDAMRRTRQRIDYARAELERFCASGQHDKPQRWRTHRKLRTDLERAETDFKWLQHSLSAALSVEGMDL